MREGERDDEALLNRYHDTQAKATAALKRKEAELITMEERLLTSERALSDERRTGAECVDFYRSEVRRMESL